MENQRQDRRPVIDKPAWIRWLAILGAVWLLLAITYAILAVQSQRKQDKLTDSGVSQVNAFAEKAGLPLLEQDIKTLHDMLKEIGDKPEVLYASVIDHKNKIIAYTDAGWLMSERQEKVDQFQGVDTWQDKDAMMFFKPIIFAQTTIGEIRLAVSLKPVFQTKKRFINIAAATLTVLLACLLWIYGRQWLRRVVDLMRRRGVDVDVHLLVCPLCGQTADHDVLFCQSSNMDRAPIFRIAGNGNGNTSGSALRLSDIGTNPKLASVKDQMIRQCAEIIKRLADNETRAVRRVGENQR